MLSDSEIAAKIVYNDSDDDEPLELIPSPSNSGYPCSVLLDSQKAI